MLSGSTCTIETLIGTRHFHPKTLTVIRGVLGTRFVKVAIEENALVLRAQADKAKLSISRLRINTERNSKRFMVAT